MNNSSTHSWQDVDDILHAFNSISRISKAKSSNQNVRKSKTNGSSSNESREYSPFNRGHAGNFLKTPSSHERVHVGMGRGKYIQELEKKFEETPEQLDLHIHSELSKIGCVYSNEVIEHNWGHSFSSSECSPIEGNSISDKQAKFEPVKENDIEDPRKEFAERVANTLKDTPNPPPLKGECIDEQPPKEAPLKSTSIKNNRQRKCRNFVLLNCANRTPLDSALKGPESFVKSPSNKHSYSGALGSKQAISIDTQGNSIFSDEDFPAL